MYDLHKILKNNIDDKTHSLFKNNYVTIKFNHLKQLNIMYNYLFLNSHRIIKHNKFHDDQLSKIQILLETVEDYQHRTESEKMHFMWNDISLFSLEADYTNWYYRLNITKKIDIKPATVLFCLNLLENIYNNMIEEDTKLNDTLENLYQYEKIN